MRICIVLLFVGACGVRETPTLREAPLLPHQRAEREDVREEAPEGAEMAEELLTLGGDIRDAERELAEASAPVFFLECLERRTGKKVNGAVMERHIRRNTKEAQACKAGYAEMSESERADYVMAWVAKQETAKRVR